MDFRWTELGCLASLLVQASGPSLVKCARSLATLTCWEIWKERNRRIFEGARLPIAGLLARIHDEARLGKLAGGLIPFDPG
ncbi:hypothetical protein BRADI_4g12962v3 [Brachypodium distachyon]|uniref:Uncharacterized protein n=1 Tax=Brachypodium distachyon TaxID=15368 RepID=A0A2K2CMG9_BRADI|nr:hypothetical protein BRADI_4g12962v3 [Brachypodium distachyon]